MKIAALALASTVALAIGSAQPVLAQTQDRTGAASQPYAQGQSQMDNSGEPDMDDNGSRATTGANTDEQNGNWRGDDGEREGRRDRGWNERRMGMGPMMMWRRHQAMMMDAFGGAQFHFARGKARMDIRCPAQTNLQACVHAATELLDKLAQLRNGNDSTTGSATGDDDGDRTNGSGREQQSDPEGKGAQTPGAAAPQAPHAPGEHM